MPSGQKLVGAKTYVILAAILPFNVVIIQLITEVSLHRLEAWE